MATAPLESTLRVVARTAFAFIPRGRTLPYDVWVHRHRVMLVVVWLHVVAFLTAAAVLGQPLSLIAYEIGPIAVCAMAAARPIGSRRLRGSFLSFAAVYCSATLVALCGGATEAHFHFFVMVTMLAAYEEWVPYLIAIGFVVLHHGVIGGIAPASVYDHPQASASPWEWTLIHGSFIVALSIINIVSWRLNEDARAHADAAHERTRRSEAEFRGAFEDAPIGLAITDLDGVVLRINRALAELTHNDPTALVGLSAAAILGQTAAEAGDGPGQAHEGRFRRGDGTFGWGLVQRSIVRDAAGKPHQIVVQLLDLTARRDVEAKLEHAAVHDALTGLPNRVLLERRAAEAMAVADGSLAVLFVDIDDFKVINDSLGHGAGDRLLLQVAERIEEAVAEAGVLARFGGDEFVVLLTDADERDAVAVAERILAGLSAPFDLDDHHRFITASVGVAVSGNAGTTAADIIRDGDAAMYEAKAAGKNGCVVFGEELRTAVVRRLDLEDGLRHAIARGELALHYQPEVDLVTQEIVGVEALMRWTRNGGRVNPGEFIPIAEHSGLVIQLGRWALEEACAQAARWHASGAVDEDFVVSVNLSARQLGSEELVEDVRRALQRHGLEPRTLCLEITESALAQDPVHARELLGAIKALGVRLAIDDFGTGYASLAQLKELLPVDLLKIDQSFVAKLITSPEDTAIVIAVLQLASRLGLKTIAEGIEEPTQCEMLREMGCDLGQGYALGRPRSAEETTAHLLAWRGRRAA
jgi:diguanylate cyclase (GGDEF)-like protein/PAS domain S-box-containing protein